MKVMLRSVMALAVCALLLTAFTAPALAADASVTYQGNADKFVFLPDNDLFQNFKGVMPGDTLTQQITVKNDTSNGVKVKIYLRAEPVDESYKAFLGNMTLKVVQDGNSVLFAAAADEQDGLAKDVCLGTFYSGADIDLAVSLAVPKEMGNEFQDSSGLVRWVFTAEEMPIGPDDPDTGDTSSVWLFGGLFAASGLGLLMLVLFRHGKAKGTRSGQKTSL